MDKLIKKIEPHDFNVLLAILSSFLPPSLFPFFLFFFFFWSTTFILYTILYNLLPGPCFSSWVLSQKTNQSNQGKLRSDLMIRSMTRIQGFLFSFLTAYFGCGVDGREEKQDK